MSDSTRLVYDIMQYTENKNILGLMMLIDFEKAFKSVTWKFLYKALEFYGFSENSIQWIQLFNNDIGTYVLQSGFLSKSIPIRRQGVVDMVTRYQFTVQNPSELYVLVSSALPTTRRDMTCAVLKAM